MVGVMLYDFTSARPVYSNFSQKLMESYWGGIGASRDSALKKAVKTGSPVGYRSDFHPDGNHAAHKRVWNAVEESGVTDALGVFATPRFNSYFYLYLGTSSPVDRMTAIEKDATQHLAGLFLRRLDAYRRRHSSARLSPREIEVLELAAAGNSDKQIARSLNLSPSTVRTLADRCFSKLKAGTRIEAVMAAMRLGLIVPK